MDRWPVSSKIVKYKYTQYYNVQTTIYVRAPFDKQTNKIFAKREHDECILKGTDYDRQADQVKEDYLDVCKGLQSQLVYITKFDETLGIATTYMGRKTTERKTSSKWKKISQLENKV